MKRTLKGIRADMGLSAKEFADKINITEDILYNWEIGRTKPDVVAVDKILEVTGLKYEEINFNPQKCN